MGMSLTDAEILALITTHRITVDVEHGFVYSHRANEPEKPMGSETTKGYLRAHISVSKKRRAAFIHRIVCVAVHGVPESPSHQVHHKNGVRKDNRGVNLEWVTNTTNTIEAINRAVQEGRIIRAIGERHYRAKLSPTDVITIRRERARGATVTSLAAQFDVSTTQISWIVNGKSWKHLKPVPFP